MAEEEASAGRARWTSDAEAVLEMRRRAETRIFAVGWWWETGASDSEGINGKFAAGHVTSK